MPLNAEHAIDGVNEEEAICGGLITEVIRKKGSAGQNLSGRARAIFTRAVNLRGFPPGVPTGVGKNHLGVEFECSSVAKTPVWPLAVLPPRTPSLHTIGPSRGYLGSREPSYFSETSRGCNYHTPRRSRQELQAHPGHVALLNRPRAAPAMW
jgi:hypothetical protein